MEHIATIGRVMRRWQSLPLFLALWFATVTVFIWAINFNLLAYILSNPLLAVGEKVSFIADAYANYFRYITNPLAFSSIAFSLLVALNFRLIIYLWRETKRRTGLSKQQSGAFVAMLGAHCLSCGTSLIAPLISAFAGSSAYLSASRANVSLVIATSANILGIILISWSLLKVVDQIEQNHLVEENRT